MKRTFISCLLLAVLILLGIQTYVNKIQTPQGLSFETLFRLTGQPFKTLDRSITRALGVNIKDEQELGVYLSPQFEQMQVPGMEKEKAYVNDIMQELAKQYNPKQLQFKVYIMGGPANAFATAGGNIVITTEMLKLLKDEAELVAILGHEKGHVDLGHCIDHMRVQAKTYRSSSGAFIDWYLRMLLNHSFSKFQENESDRFGFETLIALNYDPSALGKAFTRMNALYVSPQTSNILKDYFTTHPHLLIRSENWLEKGNRWKAQHDTQNYYVGKRNYETLQARNRLNLSEEWHQGVTPQESE